MNDRQPAVPIGHDEISLLQQIDTICDAFEKAFLLDRDARLEDFLPEWPHGQLRLLLKQLLELELDHRRQWGDCPEPESYISRFPDFAETISEVFDRCESDAKKSLYSTVEAESNTQIEQFHSPSIGLLPGSVIAGRYRIASILGKGAMGEVYRADDLKLGETVALKLLSQDVQAHPARLRMLTNEVRLARTVAHPNVCRVFDIGQSEDSHFLSMEYIDGEDLQSLIRRIGRLPLTKVLELAQQLCSGLAAAHEKGVVHRDLKPANVMIDGQGCAKLTDFGVARKFDGEGDSDGLMGTPLYMAPEQYFERQTSPQSDVFALGIIFYEMLTGRHPHHVTSKDELRLWLSDPVPHVQRETEWEEEALIWDTIQWCMQPDPKQRPPGVAAVARRLPGGDPIARAIALGTTPTPQQVVAASNDRMLEPRLAWTVFAVAMVGLLVVVGLWTNLIDKIGLPGSPRALASMAIDSLESLGYNQSPGDEAFGFEIDRDYLHYLTKHQQRWDRVKKPSPPAVRFWYRSSPQALVPRVPDWSGESYLVADSARPAFDTPGMIRMKSDFEGRLLELDVLPTVGMLREGDRREGASSNHELTEAWEQRLLDAAGLSNLSDLTLLAGRSPELLPSGYAEQRKAWELKFSADLREIEEPDLRAEAAAVGQRPVFFRLLGQWDLGGSLSAPNAAGSGTLRVIIILVWFPILVAGGSFFAWRNICRGRSDLRTAKRIARIMFAVALVVCLLKDSHVFSALEFDMLLATLAAALMVMAFVWCSYVALEPDTRRLWPRTLIGWSRLMMGNYRDPVVGRDLLVGAAAGVLVGLMKLLNSLLPLWAGEVSDSFATIINFSPLMGMRVTLAEMIAAAGFGVLYSFFTQLLFLMLLRVVLRTNLRAGVAYVVFMSLLVASRHHQFWLTMAFTGVEMTLTVTLFMRFGLLAVAVMHFVRLLLKWPMTVDLSWWGADAGLFAVIAIALLTSLGLYLVLATPTSALTSADSRSG
ncbi:serine/threonine-protein kinase [Rhodopirellula sallentina]|uniref:serine/threonine-protein kinase n=1 Tax=Rhodopirellula sallentina TaxID=1263869 RepID=UPI0007C4DB4E|nr:serine/threonine-protein kinase [Rhodopirellula sallentina]